MTNRLDKAQVDVLMALMPELRFDLVHDSLWTQHETVQQYLDFYQINFAKNDRNIIHGFGALQIGGFRIATHYWLPKNPRGTLVVLHGYYDHVGIFGHPIIYGLEQHLAVLVFDLPGHGLSTGERVAIDSFDQYADVLETVLKRSGNFFPRPLYGLGQSTGGAVLLNHLWRYQTNTPGAEHFYRLVLCAPLILPRGWLFGRFLYALARLFVSRMRRGVSRSSHNKSFTDFIEYEDCLQEKSLSVNWVGAMKAWNRNYRSYPSLNTRMLIIQGTGDLTVAWRYNMKMIRRKFPLADIQYIQDAGHQLINESDEYRNQVFNKIHQYFISN